MKIYILRHEDRTMDCTFFSPLTQTGLKNAIELIKILKKKEINLIFSSPFIRTLQTIYPYSQKYAIPISLEYSLAEFQHAEIIPKMSYSVRLPEYLAIDFNYNESYVSNFDPEDFNYPEKQKDVSDRVKKFLSNLMINYGNTDKNILLVTHQLPCNVITQLAYNKYKLDFNYPKGGLTKIFDDNKWDFEPINWSYE